jgi:hypothetical protein
MQADEDQQREHLLKEITSGREYNSRWGCQNFWIAQAQGWVALVASFGSGIAAAYAHTPRIIVAIIAAVPGALILLDRNFAFARRAQWHWLLEDKVRELEHALKYQKAEISETSKRYASLMTKMEESFPITAPVVSLEPTPKDQPKPPSDDQ